MKRFFESIVLVCLVFGFAACGTFGQAFTQAEQNCALGQLPASAEATVADVTAALSSGNWQSELEQLGLQVGVSQLDCIVGAVASGLKAKLPSHGEPDPAYLVALQRAESWLKGHGK